MSLAKLCQYPSPSLSRSANSTICVSSGTSVSSSAGHREAGRRLSRRARERQAKRVFVDARTDVYGNSSEKAESCPLRREKARARGAKRVDALRARGAKASNRRAKSVKPSGVKLSRESGFCFT